MLRALSLATALAIAPLAMGAQSPSLAPADPLPALPHPEHVLVDDLGGDGAWASAPSYKAAVRRGRLTFIPFLGGHAPRNQPLHLELERVTLGGEALAFGPGSPGLEGESLVLDRGPVVEHLDCRPEGAELVVELDLPDTASAAPLIVRYAVGGEAVGQPEEGGGLRFVGPLGDVRIGAAAAVLPGGALVPIETVLVGGGFEFRVPAAVVRASGHRVVIDPLISRGTITGSAVWIDQDVDVSCDDSVGYYVAVQRTFSATDRDVYVYRVPLQTTFSSTLVAAVDVTSIDWTEPAIAARRGFDDWLVVATRGAGAARKTRARWGNSTGSSLGLPFEIISDTFMSFEPDVGVEAGGPFLLKRWAVVLSSDISASSGSNVSFVVVGGAGTGVAPLTIPFRLTNESDGAHSPTVAAYNGPADVSETLPFLVAYAQDAFIGEEVRVRAMTRDAAITGTFDVGASGNVSSISVSPLGDPEPGLGGDRAALVVFASAPAFPGAQSSISAFACTSTASVGARVGFEDLTGAPQIRDRFDPVVASAGRHWTVAYEEVTAAAGSRQIRAVTGSLAGSRLGLVERDLPVHASTADVGRRPALVGQRGGGVTGPGARRSLLAYSDGLYTRGARIVASAELAAGSQYCEAEVNSTGRRAWLRAEGETEVAGSVRFVLQDAAAAQFTLLLTASSTNFVPGISGSDGNLCLGPDDFGRFNASTGVTTASGGFSVLLDPTAIPQANGTVAAMIGDDWYFQSWFRDTTAGGSNLSNAVRVEFDH